MNSCDLPIFPVFKNVTLQDKNCIESLVHRHAPYSDFNFTNLWAWDVLGSRKISLLNDNLVILFTDYRTSQLVLSFLGEHSPKETATVLLKEAANLKTESQLKFISEETATALRDSGLIVVEDPMNHDYIFSVKDIAFPVQKSLRTKRRLANQFTANNPQATFTTKELTDPSTYDQILTIMRCWEQNKQRANKSYEIKYEELALKRLLETAADHDLILSCIYDEGTMIAFSIDETLPNHYALSHFIKADIQYRGIYEYLNQAVAGILLTHGIEYWNWEQDLNIEGLKMLKTSYRPKHFLKKYTVSFP